MSSITAHQHCASAVGKRPVELGKSLRYGKWKNNAGQLPRLRAASLLALIVLGAAVLATSASAQQLYAVDSSRALYTIDMTTGAKTLVATVSANAGTTAGLCYDPVNNIVYLTSTSNDSLYSLDLATGNATLIGLYGDSLVVMHGLEFDDSTGTLYGVSSHNNGLYTINPLTGAARPWSARRASPRLLTWVITRSPTRCSGLTAGPTASTGSIGRPARRR